MSVKFAFANPELFLVKIKYRFQIFKKKWRTPSREGGSGRRKFKLIHIRSRNG